MCPKMHRPTHFVIERVVCERVRQLYVERVNVFCAGIITQGGEKIKETRVPGTHLHARSMTFICADPSPSDAAPAAAVASAIQIKDNSPQMGRLIA
jgi:hypothetical protein